MAGLCEGGNEPAGSLKAIFKLGVPHVHGKIEDGLLDGVESMLDPLKVGNTLIIVAVITTRRLRTVTNCFVMSLAVADWLVGIFVMPPAVAYNLMVPEEDQWASSGQASYFSQHSPNVKEHEFLFTYA
ncbi:hypothetical protein ANN_15260 [Periplaneta americana]|uniref:G-protein coupled receptors family 1 profile domain-containing protein n=1 Tax=Periplaneta americana TaxID=6978 RepID=A0ABQ8SFW7_PERAM|nr:hypothetical protein ANN_15260 [Periplaneta americana]